MHAIESTDPAESARLAGLRYVNDQRPGFSRRPEGEGFVYLDTDGQVIGDERTLARVKSLAIPPAWTDVWICPSPTGHLQATGRDEKGRKQYRYHPRWREVRDETKYHRMIAFGEALPVIRSQVLGDLSARGLPRERIVATVIQLMDETAIRVGNDEYARENHHYGLTTMEDRHVDVSGATLHFHFTGKGGRETILDVRDRRVAGIVKRCLDLPGHELFQYMDEHGRRHAIESAHVNQYLQGVTGEDFTAKDFRTWHGTVCAAQALRDIGGFSSQTEAKHNIAQAIREAATHLRNTPAICRKSYVNPEIIDAYLDGSLLPALEAERAEVEGLHPEEVAVLELLRQREAQGEKRKTA